MIGLKIILEKLKNRINYNFQRFNQNRNHNVGLKTGIIQREESIKMTGMPIKIFEDLDEKQCNAVRDEGEVNTHSQVAYPLEVINEEKSKNVNFECWRGD